MKRLAGACYRTRHRKPLVRNSITAGSGYAASNQDTRPPFICWLRYLLNAAGVAAVAGPGHGLATPSHGLTKPSHGLAKPSHGLAKPSHGLAKPSHGLAKPSRRVAKAS